MGATASIPVSIESLSAEDVANLVKSIGPAYERYRSLLSLVIVSFSFYSHTIHYSTTLLHDQSYGDVIVNEGINGGYISDLNEEQMVLTLAELGALYGY